MTFPIVDLHCDLLAYLQVDGSRTPFDPESRASYHQMRKGNVQLQTLAIFTETEALCQEIGEEQAETFQKLPKTYPGDFEFYHGKLPEGEKVALIAAIENASSFCGEEEPLEKIFQRLDAFFASVPCFYISLTWNHENRFGGGTGSPSGLKSDGEALLSFLKGKKVALDLSHASDRLANESLNYIDKHSLNLPVMASHSNFRAIRHQERNLPDEIAREIIRRGGLIGLVFYKKFLDYRNPHSLLDHIDYGLKLGGEKALAFGSDFFCLEDFPNLETIKDERGFFDQLSSSADFPNVMHWLKKELLLNEKQLKALSSENALGFLRRLKNMS